MTKQQFDNIKYLNKLIAVEEEIYDIYMYFERLEIEKKQDENSFLKLHKLNDLYTAERELLSCLPDDITQLNELSAELGCAFYDFKNTDLQFLTNDEISSIYVIERIILQIDAHKEYLRKVEYIKQEYEDYLIDEYGDDDIDLGNIDIASFDDGIERHFGEEVYIRLQERIDSGVKDKIELIDRKYKMMYVDYFFNANILCTGFNFKNMPKPSLETAAFELGVEKKEYEIHYLEYVVDLIEEAFDSMIVYEQNEYDETTKRILFEMFDLQLEIAFKSLNFRSLYEMQKKLLGALEERGMKNSLTYVIVKENLEEAINYVCNNDPKLSIGKGVKKQNKSFNI